MVRRNSGVILRQVHALLNVGTFSGLSDRQLLDRFLSRHDEVSELAFTVLVERHGPMVLGVCRRILVDPHDAEDAFQATFLVLVRKAGSVRVEGSVGRWLFGVATRVATRARADARRRRGRERPGLDRLKIVAVEESLPAVERADLQSILAEEIGRLPVRLQATVILCDLEGCSYEQSAQRLGWPVGTVKSRLSRARALLRKRLTRRGLAPDDLAITLPLLPMSLSRGLIDTTIRAAQSLIAGRLTTVGIVSASVATLTEGVLRTMYWTKFKLAIAATFLIMGGSAVVLSQAPAQKPTPRPVIPKESAVPIPGPASRGEEIDIEILERAWVNAIPLRDAATVNRIMADDFEGNDPMGNTFTKKDYLSDLHKGVFSNQPLAMDEIKTRIFGETALATSRITIQTIVPTKLLTHFYVKREGRWQCVAAHESWLSGMTWKPTDTSSDAGEQRVGMMSSMSNRPQPQGQMGMGGMMSMMGGSTSNRPQPQGQMGAMSGMMGQMGAMSGMMGSRPQAEGQNAAMMAQGAELTQIRPQFEFRVEKVFVEPGQSVKKGDRLFGVFSTELVEAKSNYEVACGQWIHDKKIWDYKAPLGKENSLPKKELIEVENNEAQSRLKMKLAKDKLLIYGLTEEEIKQIPNEEGESRARYVLRSRVDGRVATIDAESGRTYNANNIVVVIEPTSPAKPAGR